MDGQDKATDLLLETIRKELNTIITDSENTAVTATDTKSSEKLTKNAAANSTENLNENFSDESLESETYRRALFLNSQASLSLDQDLEQMKIDLNKSYELFQSISEKFETINFGRLKGRIKDLHLNTNSSNGVRGKDAATDELKEMFQQSYVNNRLDELTSEVRAKFRQHPGEFGDIPELSEFFKTCTQLEHGLGQLKKQRNDANELERRMNWSAEVSYDRVDEIRQTMGEVRDETVG